MDCTECIKYKDKLKDLLQNSDSIFDVVLDMDFFVESCNHSACLDETLESIFCAAIRYKPKDYPEPLLMRGLSHAMCIEFLKNAGLSRDKRDLGVEEQGFITNTGRFVSRREAFDIAKRANQLVGKCPDNRLYSEYCVFSTTCIN